MAKRTVNTTEIENFTMTDENIIEEYRRIYVEFGMTQKCCDSVLELSQKSPEPWKSVLEGMVHALKGDVIDEDLPKIKRYSNIEVEFQTNPAQRVKHFFCLDSRIRR